MSRISLNLTICKFVAESGHRQSPVVFSIPALSSIYKLTEVAWAISVKEGALPLPEAETKFAYLWNCRAVLDQAARIILATDNDAPGQVPTRVARPVHPHPSQSSSQQFPHMPSFLWFLLPSLNLSPGTPSRQCLTLAVCPQNAMPLSAHKSCLMWPS